MTFSFVCLAVGAGAMAYGAYLIGTIRGEANGRDALIVEQGREAEAIWQAVRAEMQADDAALAELCAILGPRECEGVE